MSDPVSKHEPVHDEVEDHHIFDADVHWMPKIEDLIDEEYIKDPVVRRKIQEDGLPATSTAAGTIYGEYSYEGLDSDVSALEAHGRAITTEEILEVTDKTGADEVLLAPDQFYVPFPDGNYPVIKNELIRAINDYLVERTIDADKGVYGGLLMPNWDIDLAVEELERHGEEDAIITAFNYFPGWRTWGHERHDPIFEKLVELNLPLQLHFDFVPSNPATLQNETKRTKLENLIDGKNRGVNLTVSNLILTGVFDKFPDLEVIINEGEVNWLAQLPFQADHHYQIQPGDICLTPRKHEMGEEYLNKLPSEYIYDNMYVTTQPMTLPDNPKMAKKLFDVCHADEMFIFSTDFPHLQIDSADWVFNNPHIDDELRDRILRGNAHDVYRMPQ